MISYINCKIFIIFIILSSTVFSQTIYDEGYQNDLIILKKFLENNHPSLYRFKNKEYINNLFEQSIESINNNSSERDFYKTIKHILSEIQDGHLSCSAPEKTIKIIEEKEKHFPLSLYFTSNKAFVNCSNLTNYKSGIEIIEINGKSINAIRKELFRYIVSDGSIETKKYWILNHSFWFYFSLVYGVNSEYEITYKGNNGILQKSIIKAELKKDIQCNRIVNESNDNLVCLEFVNNQLALLKIKTFVENDLVNAKINFSNFLESSFTEIKKRKIKSLIIDLRGNGGGRDVFGSLLYSYLTNLSFRYYKELSTVTKTLMENEHSNLSIQQPKKNSFLGKVYVLINGLSFSATSEFCNVVKNNNRAVFIGEETGGTYCGNTSGKFAELILPYSKFTIFSPTIKYIMFTNNDKNTNRGIIPDYEIIPTIEDLKSGIDKQLNFTIKLAVKNEK